MSINCNYTLNHSSGYEYNLAVYEAMFESDGLLVKVSSHYGSKHTGDSIYTTRDDSIDLAWSILEHYGVAERPPTPLVVGDFVVTNDGHVGRIVDIDVNEPALYVEGPSTNPNWHNTHETHRITKEEFVEKFLAKAAEKVNTFVGEG